MTSSSEHIPTRRPLAYATAIIGGDNIGSEYWNAYFGVSPTTIVEKGKPFVTPSGRRSTSLGWTNIWSYSTKHIISADSLTPHLAYLIATLNLPRPDLKVLIEANNLKCLFSCYWMDSTPDRVPTVDGNLADIINKSGGVVYVDEYS